MSGKEPQRNWNINLSDVQFGLVLIGGLIAVLSVVVAATSSAVSWMHDSAETHIQQNLRREVRPPSGVIYEATRQQIAKHKAESEGRIIKMEKRQIRTDLMVEAVYKKVTGQNPPEKVPE